MKKRLLFAVSIALGVGALALVAQFIDFEKAGAMLASLGPLGFIAVIANNVMVVVMPATGWWLLMRFEKLPVDYGHTLASTAMGFVVNVLTPSMYLGGEPVRLYFTSKVNNLKKNRVLATIIVSKVQEVTALVVLLLASGVIALYAYRDEITESTQISQGVIIAAMTVIGAFVVGVFVAFLGRYKPSVKILHFLAWLRIFPRRLHKLEEDANEMEELIWEALVHRWRTTLLSGLVTSLSAVSIFLRPFIYYAFASKMDVTLGISELAVIYLVSQLFMVLPLTPGGLGLFEAGVLLGFTLAGSPTPEAHAAAFAAVGRLTDILLMGVGGWLMLHYGIRHVFKTVVQPAKVEASEIKPEL